MAAGLGTVVAALLSGCLGASVLLLVIALRGGAPDPTRPPAPAARVLASLRDPRLAGRLTAGALVALAVLVLTRWPVAAAGLGALVAAWPLLFGGGRAEQLQIDRLEALVIWTESLRDTVGANTSLEQAVPTSAQYAPPLIRPALNRLVGQLHARVAVDKALLTMASWLDDASADLVLAALILNAQRRGPGLRDVLTGLSIAAREELDMRRRVSAGRQGLRRGVQVVVVMTVCFGVFLSTIGGSYVRPYDSLAGQVALAVVLGIFAFGFGWMRRLSASAPVMPFLARPGQRPSPEDLAVVASLTGLSPAAAAALAAAPPPPPVAASRPAGRRP